MIQWQPMTTFLKACYTFRAELDNWMDTKEQRKTWCLFLHGFSKKIYVPKALDRRSSTFQIRLWYFPEIFGKNPKNLDVEITQSNTHYTPKPRNECKEVDSYWSAFVLFILGQRFRIRLQFRFWLMFPNANSESAPYFAHEQLTTVKRGGHSGCVSGNEVPNQMIKHNPKEDKENMPKFLEITCIKSWAGSYKTVSFRLLRNILTDYSGLLSNNVSTQQNLL